MRETRFPKEVELSNPGQQPVQPRDSAELPAPPNPLW
jgi:hypothetical protein